MNTIRINLVQNDAGTDVATNLADIDGLLVGAPDADLIALPELFMLRDSSSAYQAAAETESGPVSQWMSSLAQKHGAWVLGGSILEQTEQGICNTSILFNPKGQETTRYRKIHLFDVDLPDGSSIRESQQYVAGSDPVHTTIEGWTCGFTICYDLRFPELFRQYADVPVDMIFVPANFTQLTGRMHWLPLLQARAIENQCYIIAPNQCGKHPENDVVSHGHSMVIDPWGKVMVEAGESPCVLSVECSPDSITDVRQRIPSLRHRRF